MSRRTTNNYLDAARSITNYNAYLWHTTTYKTGLLAMYNDAVRIKTEEIDVQRMHIARQRIGTT